MSTNSRSSESFKNNGDTRKKEDKWWAPVPVVPLGGLSEESSKNLKYRRDCANQIHKAAMAINNGLLSEMDIPDSYLANLPKVNQYNCKNCLITLISWYTSSIIFLVYRVQERASGTQSTNKCTIPRNSPPIASLIA